MTTNSDLVPGEQGHDHVLSGADRDEVLSHMQTAAAAEHLRDPANGHDPSESRASTVARGLRWSDVPLAAATACGEPGVELAIVSSHSDAEGIRFELVSVDDRPAELIVRRLRDGRVYEAAASAGWNGEDQVRARRLIEAFDRAMDAFGRKRGFIDADARGEPLP